MYTFDRLWLQAYQTPLVDILDQFSRAGVDVRLDPGLQTTITGSIRGQDLDDALQLAARGKGSLAGTLVIKDVATAVKAITSMAATHGRLQILDRAAAPESTGHGSALPYLKHGGPGRAGGGEELGGLRAVKHLMQRAALQGSPAMLAAVTGETAS